MRVIQCPVPGCKYEEEYGRGIPAAWAKIALGAHMLEEHPEWVKEWFRRHRDKWRYIRNKLASLVSEGTVIGWSPTLGEVYRAEDKELAERIKSAENILELHKILLDEAEKAKKASRDIQGVWIVFTKQVLYWLEEYVYTAVEREAWKTRGQTSLTRYINA